MEVIISQIPPRWQNALQDRFTDPLSLLHFLELLPSDVPYRIDPTFPLRVPRHFVQKMKKGDPHDPLLKQVLSTKMESQKNAKFTCDPLQEKNYNPLPGLLHKYPSRVLLTFTPSCAVHCRYCFRRHFPYEQNNPGQKGWLPIVEYIAHHPEIVEVILSGGDPLMANDEIIERFLTALSSLPHVKFLRFHTRLPVVIPERIHPTFVAMLKSFRFVTTMIYHINHPNEITPDIAEGVQQLHTHGIRVLNQSVLLKGINDTSDCLRSLSISLYSAGIMPYYIHLLDPVEGTSHFHCFLTHAKTLRKALQQQLPGYLVPRFVREIAGEKSKISL